MAKPERKHSIAQQEVSVEQRRAQVAIRLFQNKTQRQIAREVGCSVGTVCMDISAIREEWAQRRICSYEEYIDAELARLGEVEAAIWGRVISGEDDQAIDRWLRIFNERAKILGLYAPQNHKVITVTELDKEIEELEKKLGTKTPARR